MGAWVIMPGSTSSFAPRLMLAREAAHYLGMSESNLRKLDLPRKIHGALRLYDRLDLDHFASILPLEDKEESTCNDRQKVDRAFGCDT